MHLLVTQPGEINDGSEAVDLGQSPGDIVFLSAAASDLAILAEQHRDENYPSLRLANLMQLSHNMSVDVYVENTIAEAKLVIVRLLGGLGYWPYGIEQIRGVCLENNIMLAIVPGDDTPDPELTEQSTLGPEACHRIWQYCAQSGADNIQNLLNYASSLIGSENDWAEPVLLVRAGLYWPGLSFPDLSQIKTQWTKDQPATAIVFYRALVQTSDLAPIDALIDSLQAKGINPLPIFVGSLKDPTSAEIVKALFKETTPHVILNCTGFAVSSPGKDMSETPFSNADCPVFQVVLSGGTFEEWQEGARGLSPKDLAMSVALPEVDGRLITRAISFKKSQQFDEATEVAVIKHEPVPSRIDFVAALAASWTRLRQAEIKERRVAVVVANYPNKDGRLGNGVGLDTPAGVAAAFERMIADGYNLGEDAPTTSKDIMNRLLAGPTNAAGERIGGETFSLESYQDFFQTLPQSIQEEMIGRWGEPSTDPFVSGDNFILPAHIFGNVILAVQPARGYNIDPTASYHDPDLVPPHGYLAFYAWLRTKMDIHAIIHFGKHGNLEWLPGKALMLDDTCYPEIALGALPHLYPFIVNDPGEGTQAKRRSNAIIIDHLTPPLTRAESYGPLRDLEQLVDEYYQAAGMDPRRLKILGEEIIDLSQRIGLDRDVGIETSDDENAALSKIDNYLCELKEMQIRDGLHIFGISPSGRQETDLLVALTRLQRNNGEGEDASLIRALAKDLGFGGFDPLDCDMGAEWQGARPMELECFDGLWRSNGDTVERLEMLAQALVSGARKVNPEWQRVCAVLDFIQENLRLTVADCGAQELNGLMLGLAGAFVAPGSSGAPTRGRLDVLPTGKNFYSVDVRAVPTPAAWKLGWKSATLMIERHFQDNGEYPKRLAMSAWGTANMRTGGDDIAQALALMGVQPVWDKQANRVTGFEVMPLTVLGRPRVDVVFRISGFFRDAFPAQVDLLDSAVRAVSAQDESEYDNPLAAQTAKDSAAFVAAGVSDEVAARRASFRIFGSKPGAYGAGLQTLIDERCWETDEDLSRAYVAWGGYAYGDGAEGEAENGLFEARLKGVEIVVHNQDNREHDLLDSDDYYQFEGGITAAVRELSGNQPVIYHNDHSRPEAPKIRTLSEEIGRVVRARAANPKWIDGVMRHGYKGAFEIAATVDYLFAFAATAKVVEDHHFDQLFEAYLEDERVRDFIEENNAPALKEIADRFDEAIERGFWHPRSNSVTGLLEQLRNSVERKLV
jgi:cobaltochelatase CobN